MASITTRFVRRARRRGVTVYTRRQWRRGTGVSLAVYGWRRIWRRHKQLPGKPTDTLVQHITVTHDDGEKPWNFREDMAELHHIGTFRFGTGISYNLVWDMQTGEIGIGQAFDAAGAHTLNEKNVPGYSDNLNYYSVAIAAIGMPGAQPSAKALHALKQTIAAMIDVKVITPGHDYDPHSKFAAKSCPTEAIIREMDEINRDARRLARQS